MSLQPPYPKSTEPSSKNDDKLSVFLKIIIGIGAFIIEIALALLIATPFIEAIK